MITAKQAYEWVKTGHWTLDQFTKWLAKVEQAIEEGKGAW